MATALIVLGVLAAYQLLALLAMVVAWRTPRVPPRRTPADVRVRFEDVRIPTENRRTLHGWWIPAEREQRPALVLMHGWGRNVERMLPYIEMLRTNRYHLLAIDARQHGLSDRDGHASMKKFSEDIRAAVAWLAARTDVDAGHLGVIGLSIGGAAAIHAGAHEPRLHAFVTVGAFAHPRQTMEQMGFGSALLAPAMPLVWRFVEWRVGARFDELAPERHVAHLSGPLLLVHGERDTVVPVAHAFRLFAAAGKRARLWVMPDRGHSDPHLEPGFDDTVSRFLAAAFGETRELATNVKAGAA